MAIKFKPGDTLIYSRGSEDWIGIKMIYIDKLFNEEHITARLLNDVSVYKKGHIVNLMISRVDLYKRKEIRKSPSWL